MNAILRPWRSTAVLLAISIAAAPLPAAAGETDGTAGTTRPGIRTSVEKVVTTQVLAPTRPVAAARQSTSTDLGSKTFFKTPAGIAVLVALGAGIGYAVYSTSNDRVKSPAK